MAFQVLKTVACQGLRVGPAKRSIWNLASCGRESLKWVTQKGGVRCEGFDGTLSVVLETPSLGFYRFIV